MASSKDIFVKCDQLEGLPEPNRRNYLFELDLLEERLPMGARVLQVGSMDGERAVRLLKRRPDIQFTGLEIDPELVELAQQNVAAAGVRAKFVTGDITKPPKLSHFDWVLCLNHSLGYIADEKAALRGMRRLGEIVAVSVYGQRFDVGLAREYFGAIGLADYGWVRRYRLADVREWGGGVLETPIGYWVELKSS
jgi:SAM-dependent methyltransferase